VALDTRRRLQNETEYPSTFPSKFLRPVASVDSSGWPIRSTHTVFESLGSYTNLSSRFRGREFLVNKRRFHSVKSFNSSPRFGSAGSCW
jgi:hypothetical protein